MIAGIQVEIMARMAEILDSEVGADAKLHYRTVTRPPGFVPGDESSAVGTVVANVEVPFRCLFHQVDHRLAGFQRFAEVQTGDVMIDFMQDLGLESKEDPRIEVVGVGMFVQKTASRGLLEAWDVYMGGGGTMRTLLLSPVQ
jgi:hypothetical protein